MHVLVEKEVVLHSFWKVSHQEATLSPLDQKRIVREVWELR